VRCIEKSRRLAAPRATLLHTVIIAHVARMENEQRAMKAIAQELLTGLDKNREWLYTRKNLI
jgi:hypothetical protein